MDKMAERLLQDMCERFPGETFTQEQIADYIGVSRQRIDQIEQGIRAKLREACNSDILTDLEDTDGE